MVVFSIEMFVILLTMTYLIKRLKYIPQNHINLLANIYNIYLSECSK